MNKKINLRITVASVLLLLFFTAYSSETIIGKINNPACSTEYLSKMGGNIRGDLLLENYDVDDDETDELIYASTLNSEYLMINVLKYDDKKEVFSKFSSFEPPNTNLSSIQLIDFNNDSRKEICITSYDGDVFFYDILTFMLLKHLKADGAFSTIRSDIDNDGAEELIVPSYTGTFVYNLNDTSLKYRLAITSKMITGNVDNDNYNEIITSDGKVMQLVDSVLVTEWSFAESWSIKGNVTLIDNDGDGISTISMLTWSNHIQFYDAVSKSMIKEYTSDIPLNGFDLFDYDGIGTKEIITFNSEGGGIHIIDYVNLKERKYFENPEYSVSGVLFANVDHNEGCEMVFASDNFSNMAGKLHVYDLKNDKMLWESKCYQPPYGAIELFDVNGDGKQEIITTCNIQTARWKIFSAVLIIDPIADTIMHEIILDDIICPYEPINKVEITDFDADGNQDLVIVPAIYTATVVCVDLNTFEVQVYKGADINTIFSAWDIDDFNNDGKMELIAFREGQIRVYDPFTTKYLPFTINIENVSSLVVNDIDKDGINDIIALNGKINIINGKTKEIKVLNTGYITSTDFFDWNGDSVLDVIASEYLGNILSVNLKTCAIDTLFFSDRYNIRMINHSDLDKDGTIELILSDANSVEIVNKNGNYQKQVLPYPHSFNSTSVGEIDTGAETEIFVSAYERLLKFTPGCYKCIDFDMHLTIDKTINCLPESRGALSVHTDKGAEPFNYFWNGIEDSISVNNLIAGRYTAEIIDKNGCSIKDSVELTVPILQTKLETENVSSCDTATGRAKLSVIEGEKPFRYQWSTGDTLNMLDNLSQGNYSVSITDSNYCSEHLDFLIKKDTLYMQLYKRDLWCNSIHDGRIIASVFGENEPYSYLWSNNETSYGLFDLPSGFYSVTVTDAKNCSISDTITLKALREIKTSIITTPDNSDTPEGDGTASVIVSGGIRPYFYYWDNSYTPTNDSVVSLFSGTHFLIVKDVTACSKVDTIEIYSYLNLNDTFLDTELRVYPNPFNNELNIQIEETLKKEEINCQLVDVNGRYIEHEDLLFSNNNYTKINTSELKPGLYFLKFTSSSIHRTIPIIKK